MDRRPRAEGVRLMAAAAHLPGIALVLLLWPKWRSVRLVRYHATLALGLQGLCLGLLLAGSLLTSLLGNLPGLGLGFSLMMGLLNVVALMGWTVLAALGAYGGYQGQRTVLPLLSAWAEQASNRRAGERVEAPRPPIAPPPPSPVQPLWADNESPMDADEDDEEAFRPRL